MKNRLLNNWSWSRIAFLLIGLLVIFQAADANQWWGLALGAYVTAMGLFGFGCAAGNCAGRNCSVEPDRDQKITK